MNDRLKCVKYGDCELEEFRNGGAATILPKRSLDITIEFVGERKRGLPPVVDLIKDWT